MRHQKKNTNSATKSVTSCATRSNTGYIARHATWYTKSGASLFDDLVADLRTIISESTMNNEHQF